MWAIDSLGIRTNAMKWLQIMESSKILVLLLKLHDTCSFIILLPILLETVVLIA